MKRIDRGLARRAGVLTVGIFLAAALRAETALASTLQNDVAKQHFGWVETVAAMAQDVIPVLSMLAIVGGLVMWGLGGGGEGVMKKIGPVVAAFGVAGFVLTSGSFLGIGAAVL